MPLGQEAASLEEVADEEILYLLIECEMHAATATAAARANLAAGLIWRIILYIYGPKDGDRA